MNVIKTMSGILVVSILLVDCSSSYYFQKATPLAVNKAILKNKNIQLMTFDGTQYDIKLMEMDSVFIRGKGKTRNTTESDWKPFSGSIPIDSVDLIQVKKKTIGQDLVVLGSALALAYFFPRIEGIDGVWVDVEYIGGSGTSCPYIYSWNGYSYNLDAEAFGVAFGKALELTTWSILPNLKEDASKLRVRISNERLETHYINSVELVAVESDSEATPVLDSKNQAWPTYHLIPPLTALDKSKNDVLKMISAQDQNYYEADLSDLSNSSDFEDVIDLTFVKHASASDGSLVIRAINTEFSETVFKKMFEFLGDQSLAFMHAAETDPEMIDILKHWIEESSLKVFVWDGKEWAKQGRILPEANVAPFSRIVRIHSPDSENDTLRVRLVSLADVWKIDAINMDWTAVQPLTYESVDLVSAAGPVKKDIMPLIKENDDRYAILMPPQQIDLTFQPPGSERNKKVSYVLKTRGYLHEWFNQQEEGAGPAELIPDDMRIPYLRALLQNKNLFLPPVYAEWRDSKISRKGDKGLRSGS